MPTKNIIKANTLIGDRVWQRPFNSYPGLPAGIDFARAISPAGSEPRCLTVPCEIIFVEDCGSDNSWTVIKELAERDPRVRGLKLSATTDSIMRRYVVSVRHDMRLSSHMTTSNTLLIKYHDSSRGSAKATMLSTGYLTELKHGLFAI